MYGSGESYVFKTISTDKLVLQNTDVKITDLKRSTKYSIIVQAFNNKGPGPQSEEVVAETLANDPPPSPKLILGFVEQTVVELKWTFDENELLISGYYLYYKRHQFSWQEIQISGRLDSYRFTHLQCGTYYQFYIIAYNAIGKGDPSQVLSTKTKGARKCYIVRSSSRY